MAGFKIHADLVINNLEIVEIHTLAELVLTPPIHIIEQNVFFLIGQFKNRRPFHGMAGLLFIVGLFYPAASSEVIGHGFPDSVSVPLCFVKHMEYPVFVDNIAVDAGFSIFREEKLLRCAFQIGEILIGISIIDNISPFPVLHGPVNHVFFGMWVINRLGSPHPLQVFLSRIFFLDVDGRRSPVDKIFRFQ